MSHTSHTLKAHEKGGVDYKTLAIRSNLTANRANKHPSSNHVLRKPWASAAARLHAGQGAPAVLSAEDVVIFCTGQELADLFAYASRACAPWLLVPATLAKVDPSAETLLGVAK